MASPLVRILNSTFHRSPTGPAFFKNLNINIPPLAAGSEPQRWSIIGPSNAGKSTLLQVLQGSHICLPPGGRTFPAITDARKYPGAAIALVDFSAQGAFGERVRGEYMSSRYESQRHNPDDLSLRQWLERTALNLPLYTDNFDFDAHQSIKAAEVPLEIVTTGLRLTKLLDQPVSTLSNGQGRRARIAQALLRGVDLLLLDEPFMGLDPASTQQLSKLILRISSPDAIQGESKIASQVVVSQRPQDHLPDWVTHIAYLQQNQILAMGEREEVLDEVGKNGIKIGDSAEQGSGSILKQVWSQKGSQKLEKLDGIPNAGEPIVQMDNIKIAYRSREILENFSWTIRRGERWGLFGPNGSGKTTLLSIITSDHPLSYALPVQLFGRYRLPTPGIPGISIFEIQSRIGHSSPEIWQFFPRRLNLRDCVESAWADTFISKPAFTADAKSRIDEIFAYFSISDADQQKPFHDHGLSTQKLALFMRALVKRPDIVILDEAFSGMDDKLRDRCMRYLRENLEERQGLIVVSHLEEEIPGVVDRWVRLPEAGSGEEAVFGSR